MTLKNSDQIYIEELRVLQATSEQPFLLDVRQPDERAVYHLGGVLIPLAELPARLEELPYDQLIVVYCRSGHRSQSAVEFLKNVGFHQVKNLVGGVLAAQTQTPSVEN